MLMNIDKLPGVLKGIEDTLGDSEEAKLIKEALLKQFLGEDSSKKSNLVAGIIGAVSKGSGSWITSNWRPVLAMGLAAILANNYLIYPYLTLLVDQAPYINISKEFWVLIDTYFVAYAGGRSAEKIVKNIQDNKKG